MKVLYHIGHHFFLLPCLLHSIINYKDSEIVFLYNQELNVHNGSTFKFAERLSKNFEKYGKFIAYLPSYHNLKSAKECLTAIKEIYENLFVSNDIDINSFDYIYNSFDEWNPLGIYFNSQLPEKKINLFIGAKIFADNSGDDCEKILQIEQNLDPIIAELSRSYGAYRKTDNIDKIIRLFNVISPYYLSFEYLDIMEMLDSISKDELYDVLRIFEYDKLNFNTYNSYDMVCFSRWFIDDFKNRNIDYYLFYEYFIDYFGVENQYIIKYHPRQEPFCNGDIKAFFPCAISEINGYFPSQLLCKCKDLKVSAFMSIDSGCKESRIGSKNIFFDNWCLKPRKEFISWINKWYITCELADFLGIANIRYYGLAVEVIEKINKYWNQYRFNSVKWFSWRQYLPELQQLPSNTLMVLGNLDWNVDLPSEKVCIDFINAVQNERDDILYILFNTNNDINIDLLSDEVKKYIYVIEIVKRKDREKIRDKMHHEKIYVFTRNKTLITKIYDFRTHKRLFNTGITIYTRDIQWLYPEL